MQDEALDSQALVLKECLKCGKESLVPDEPGTSCSHCGAVYEKVERAVAGHKNLRHAAVNAGTDDVPTVRAPLPEYHHEKFKPSPRRTALFWTLLVAVAVFGYLQLAA